MSRTVWNVLIADLKSSRRIDARKRGAVDAALQRAIRRTERRFDRAFRLGPEVLKGDELQAVLRADAPALHITDHLRAGFVVASPVPVALRAGIGSGPVERLSSKGPFASEGPAFHRAREALDLVKAAGGRRLTHWIRGSGPDDDAADVLLALHDEIASRWTGAQWEAIAGRIENLGLQEIAAASGVSFQSVSKRLRAASWSEVSRALQWLEARSTARG